MAPKLQELEVRLVRIEKELQELRHSLSQQEKQPWYRQIVGDYAQDPALAKIVRLGQRIRRGEIKG
jgi:hypothetical protein